MRALRGLVLFLVLEKTEEKGGRGTDKEKETHEKH